MPRLGSGTISRSRQPGSTFWSSFCLAFPEEEPVFRSMRISSVEQILMTLAMVFAIAASAFIRFFIGLPSVSVTE